MNFEVKLMVFLFQCIFWLILIAWIPFGLLMFLWNLRHPSILFSWRNIKDAFLECIFLPFMVWGGDW